MRAVKLEQVPRLVCELPVLRDLKNCMDKDLSNLS